MSFSMISSSLDFSCFFMELILLAPIVDPLTVVPMLATFYVMPPPPILEAPLACTDWPKALLVVPSYFVLSIQRVKFSLIARSERVRSYVLWDKFEHPKPGTPVSFVVTGNLLQYNLQLPPPRQLSRRKPHSIHLHHHSIDSLLPKLINWYCCNEIYA